MADNAGPARLDALPPERYRVKTVVTTLVPLIAGLAFARAGLIVASYGSYRQSDEGIFTDGAMIITLVVLLIPFAFITSSKRIIPKPWVNRCARICIALEAASIFALAAVSSLGTACFELRFCLSVLCTLSASGSMYYWLRRMRGTGTIVSVIFVFSALIVSEIELLIMAYLPQAFSGILASAACLAQFPCMIWARGRTTIYSQTKLTEENAFPGFDEGILKSRSLLIAMAISIGLLGIVAGFLRGYPDGNSIPFTSPTRLLYAALTIALSACTIGLTVGRRKRVMPVGFFLLLEILACLSLICFAAFPNAPDIGAVSTTTMNALMVGLAWYIVIAFMSFGWRDPYYYALAGWFVWLGARSLVRTAFIATPIAFPNYALAIAIAATLVVLSAQATLSMFLSIEHHHAEDAKEAETNPSTLVRIMGLDKDAESIQTLSDVREMSLRQSAEIIGKQFLLSEREVEVLALYASGLTQKRVAEELYITQSTAHEHIKRIYSKTGLHSRQEILDYIRQYAS